LYKPDGHLLLNEVFLDAGDYKYDSTNIVVQNTRGKYGIISLSAQTIVPYQYDYAPRHISDDYLQVGQNINGRPLYGVLDRRFHTVVPVRYREITFQNTGCLLGYTPEKQPEIYDKSGTLVWTGEAGVEVDVVFDPVIILRKGDQHGVHFRTSKKTIWVKDADVYFLEKPGFVLCRDENSRVNAIYSLDAEKVNLDGFDLEVSAHSQHYAKISRNRGDRYKRESEQGQNLVNMKGTPMLKEFYQIVYDWNDVYCVVGKYEKDKNGHYQQVLGVLDIFSNKWLLEMKYRDIHLLKEAIAVYEDEKWQILNLKGKKISKYDYVSVSFNDSKLNDKDGNDLYKVDRLDGKYANGTPRRVCGYINEQGKEIVPSIYTRVDPVRDRYNRSIPHPLYIAVLPDEKDVWNGPTALLDERFHTITSFAYAGIGYYWDGYMFFVVNETYEGEVRRMAGVMNAKGKVLVAPHYGTMEYVTGRGFVMSYNGRFAYVGLSGKELIPLQYKNIYLFGDNYLRLMIDGKESLATMDGKVLFEPKYIELQQGVFLDGSLLRVIPASGKTYAGMQGEFYMDINGTIYGDE